MWGDDPIRFRADRCQSLKTTPGQRENEMASFPQRVQDNILPLSVGDTLPEVFTEWLFTERAYDYGKPTKTCELCEQESLRYHFEIRNRFTQKTLWVGSHCILKYQVPVFEQGKEVTDVDAKKYLNHLMKKMQMDSCLAALQRLAGSEGSSILQLALDYYRQHATLSPKHAYSIFWRLRSHRIDHNPSAFKVNLKPAELQEELRGMVSGHVHTFWPALTSKQKELASSLGHTPPAT